jgi:DNA-binding CsgD family transcriptional regulator
MTRLNAFDGAREAILEIKEGGAIEAITDAAADLFRVDVAASRGIQCWEIARLKSTDGLPFCGPDCAIWREAREGRLQPLRTVVVHPPGRAPRLVELFSFVTEPAGVARAGVFHLLHPLPQGTADSSGTPMNSARLGALSDRETEVLGLLASGLAIQMLADRLFISPLTVRNHVKSILHKLGVHRSVDAILLWLKRDAPDRTTAENSDHLLEVASSGVEAGTHGPVGRR